MITDREKKLRKKYEAENLKIERMMDRFKLKYGRNWTKNDLTFLCCKYDCFKTGEPSMNR